MTSNTKKSPSDDGAMKRRFEKTCLLDDEEFDLKKVKKEIGDDLVLNRDPELTPAHNVRFLPIKLELKEEKSFAGYDTTPTDSDANSPSSINMGTSFEKLIAQGRARFNEAKEKIESERAKKAESSRSDDPEDLTWSSWWLKKRNDAEHRVKRDNYRANQLCFNCKRYGHIKAQCRNRFYWRYPQKYLDENPALKEKLRKQTIRKNVNRKTKNKQPPKEEPSYNNLSHNINRAVDNINKTLLPRAQANPLQLTQITEAVNQILYNQLQMMKNQTNNSCENCKFNPNHHNDNKVAAHSNSYGHRTLLGNYQEHNVAFYSGRTYFMNRNPNPFGIRR